ncbi:MAG TPA: FkbM family methyltransferase [Nitrospirales bacterium]|nr:FkbM family methyltransferase [Nitrospiraceae bacterium]HNP28146.1 FkbM family methyltransferase [Nitrospirales bacterium]
MQRLVRKIKKVYYRQRGSFPATIDGVPFTCDPYHVKFWNAVSKGKWEPHTLSILSRYLNSQSIYCDIGTWIGPTVLHASTKCKKVYCFEPDRISYRYLLENLQHNNILNVIPFNLAITPQDSVIKIGTFAKSFGRSKTSVLKGTDDNAVFCPGLSLKTVLQSFNLEKIDFLKIDIEGGEFSLIPSLETYLKEQHPLLYLSTHPQFLASQARAEHMKNLLNSLTMYDHWYDSSLHAVDPSDLLSPDYLTKGHELFLMAGKQKDF